jgi:type I restriction-modification system DNA methylase subunit
MSDVVIANPPWNQDGYDEEVIKKGEFWKPRFRYGFVPKQSGHGFSTCLPAQKMILEGWVWLSITAAFSGVER